MLTLTQRGRIGDLVVQRRGRAQALYLQVKTALFTPGNDRVSVRVRLNPKVFPVHPAFCYAFLFVQPPGVIATAWLVTAADVLRLIPGSTSTRTTIRVVHPHLHRRDEFEPYRLAPVEIGARLLRLLDDVKQAEPPSEAALKAFAAT